ncbi:hypothetical protein FF38_01957 [Lucilia cuprina]|uniref:Uncharacterized protein n=1 Tax=Lucilia cuprina TaxID=7375 RepID=A0A0L0CR74_LUCCU|nr:hypothetical protein FF38_01957 [Lucilia cuprina]
MSTIWKKITWTIKCKGFIRDVSRGKNYTFSTTLFGLRFVLWLNFEYFMYNLLTYGNKFFKKIFIAQRLITSI